MNKYSKFIILLLIVLFITSCGKKNIEQYDYSKDINSSDTIFFKDVDLGESTPEDFDTDNVIVPEKKNEESKEVSSFRAIILLILLIINLIESGIAVVQVQYLKKV